MDHDQWQAFQEKERRGYLADHAETGSYFGHFSVREFHTTIRIGERLAAVDGPILDIGCGILPVPEYLQRCTFHAFGIDPYAGEHKRLFPFAQAMGEGLPFRSGSFSTALLMSVLDHTYDPGAVVAEARRVLKSRGLLFIWHADRRRPDGHHPWCLPGMELKNMMGAVGFKIIAHHTYPGDRDIGFPRTCMMVAEREAFGD